MTDAAQYAIDIAARMTGIEQTNAELDALTAQLSGSGKGAEHFQEALRRIAVDLDGARIAAKASAEALSAGQAQYKDLETAAAQATKAAENAARAIAVRDDTAAKAQAAAAAVAAYAGKLDGLKAAAGASGGADEAANAALVAGLDKYQKLEAAAAKAQRSAAKAANQASGVVPDDLKAEADAANAAVNAYADTLKGLEKNSADAAEREKALGAQLGNVKKLAGHVDKSLTGESEGLAKMQGALSAMGGPLGSLGSKIVAPVKGFADLTQTMGTTNAMVLAGVVGFAALAVAVVAVTAAVVAGAVAIAVWAVNLGDAKRSAALSSAAMEAMHPELIALRGEFAAVADATGMHTDELQELAGKLRAAHVAAADMPAALRAAALAETALGKGGSADFIADIQSGRKSVKALAADTTKALGGIVAQQMRGLDAQSARLKSNFNGIFSGLDIDPALNGMQTIVGIFDKASASGQTLSFFFNGIFQPLVDQAENAGYAVEAFVLGFEKSALQMYLGAKPMLKVLGFGDTNLETVLNGAAKAGEIFAVVAVAIAVPIVALIGIFGVVAAAAESLVVIGLAPLIAGFYLFRTIPQVVGDALGAVPAVIGKVWADTKAAFPSVGEWVAVGRDLVMGLVSGITGQAGAVVSAIGGVVTGAVSSAKRLLGIASPSKVFKSIGGYGGEGLAVGFEDEASTVHAAMSGLVEPPPEVLSKADALSGAIDVPVSPLAGMPPISIASTPSTPSGGGSSGAASSKCGGGLNLAGAVLNFYGIKDAAGAADRFEEALTRILEGDALEVGDAVPA